jgi:dihydroorotate dehydrogenase
MKSTLVKYRNKAISLAYRGVAKPFFFRFDPEDVHDHMTAVGKKIGSTAILRNPTALLFSYSHASLWQTIHGITFKNPVGLAAGFDKNAELIETLPSVGFGFAEIGSMTGEACLGNPKPRLWRLPKSKSLVVYYGLKNEGCEKLAPKIELAIYRTHKDKQKNIPIGTSVAMTNCQENLFIDNAIKDYAKAFTAFASIGDYTTVNISCPNTCGGQPFVQPDALEQLLTALDPIKTEKPIFIKISPDISMQDIDRIIDLSHKHRIHGIICTNLTKKRDNDKIKDAYVPDKGGLSGKVVQDLSDHLISHIYKRESSQPSEHRLTIIGCGGIFSAKDAYKKIRLGASLVQMITGMIFEGPQVISEINRGLVELLKKDGFKNISEAVGVDSIA